MVAWPQKQSHFRHVSFVGRSRRFAWGLVRYVQLLRDVNFTLPKLVLALVKGTPLEECVLGCSPQLEACSEDAACVNAMQCIGTSLFTSLPTRFHSYLICSLLPKRSVTPPNPDALSPVLGTWPASVEEVSTCWQSNLLSK